MTPEEATRLRILALSAVTAEVSTRVRLLRLHQHDTLPAIRVQVVDDLTSYHARGGSGHYRSRIQVDCFAKEASGTDPYADAVALAAAVHGDDAGSGLSGWQGTVGGSPDAIQIHAMLRVDRMVSYESEELREVRCRQDYQVHWSPVR